METWSLSLFYSERSEVVCGFIFVQGFWLWYWSGSCIILDIIRKENDILWTLLIIHTITVGIQ